MSRGNELRLIVRDDADRQKWSEWLRRTIETRGWRERRRPHSTPHRHGTGNSAAPQNASSLVSMAPIHYSRPDPRRAAALPSAVDAALADWPDPQFEEIWLCGLCDDRNDSQQDEPMKAWTIVPVYAIYEKI